MHLWMKSTRKLSLWKEILSWMIWDFSIIRQKHALTCPSLYGLICQTLYHTSLISPKRELDETVNFRNFRNLLTNKFSAFFFGILAPQFQTGKTKQSGKAHEASTMAITCRLGKLMQHKKIVIIKMNMILYFEVIGFWMFVTLCFSNNFSNFEGFLMPSIGS